MKTFVTGGTGLLGSTLVRELVAEGHSVKALVRSPEKVDRLLDVEIVVGDMLEVDGFDRELDDCDAVFHTAAYFREYYGPGDHWGTLEKVNVDGTVELLDAAERRGVETFVHVSSEGVIGSNPAGGPGDETTMLAPSETDNLYFRSKVLAERAIDEFLTTHEMDVIRILPGWMFGPGDAAPTASGQLVLDLVHRDVMGLFDGGGHVTDVRDVARAMVDAVERGAPGERYIVAGPYASLPEIAVTLESVTGVPAPRTLPYPVVAVVARLGVLYSRLTGRPVLLTPEGVATLRSNHRVDSRKAERDLGATFRPLSETLRDAVRWYRDHDYVGANAAVDSRLLVLEGGANGTETADALGDRGDAPQ